jgi:hypothetical protein
MDDLVYDQLAIKFGKKLKVKISLHKHEHPCIEASIREKGPLSSGAAFANGNKSGGYW